MTEPSEQRLLLLLKSQGELTAGELGARLGMTAMGARQHLLKLERRSLVLSADRREARGRPKKYWRLTAMGHGRFPDRHAVLTLELLRSIRAVFGAAGVERLIRHRE